MCLGFQTEEAARFPDRDAEVSRGCSTRRKAPKALARFKERIRELTRRTRGISLTRMIEQLSCYLNGWRAYFGFCQTPSVLAELDSWIRRRLRSVVWKQWKRGKRRFAELRLRDVGEDLAAKTPCTDPYARWCDRESPRGLSYVDFSALIHLPCPASENPTPSSPFHTNRLAASRRFRCQFAAGGPPTTYGSLCFTMCQMIVASRRITATRAIFAPRRRLIRLYHAFSRASRRNTCRTMWPRTNRAMALPCFVIEPSRSVASPELRQPGVRPQ